VSIETPHTSYLVTDSYSKGDHGVAGIGVAFRGGRIICGDVVEAPDLVTAELLAVLRALEISAKARPIGGFSVVYTDHELAAQLLTEPDWDTRLPLAREIRGFLEAHKNLSVQHSSWECVKSARIVARQVFKAWECSFNRGVTWAPAQLGQVV
jgi:hypothetical protein